MALLARPTFSQTSTITRDVDGLDDFKESLAWFHNLFIETAKAELADAQSDGALLKPVVLVDGKKGKSEEQVKPFGSIVYVESMGPLKEAIAAATAYLLTAAPVKTGHYVDALRWYANGNPVSGNPDAEKVGLRGNVQLVDLAPYASTLEIEVPRGLIYGAYTFLSRMFGGRLNISFQYANAAEFGGFIEKPGNPAITWYAVPVLTMGNPASTVRDGARGKPGADTGQEAAHKGRLWPAKGLPEMSSPGFRLALKTLLAANWTHCPVFDLSEWISAGQVPAGITEAFLALQFRGGPERIATIGAIEHHSWREDGTVILHLAFPTGENSARALEWGEELVLMLRGRRLGSYTIDFMEHFSDFAGAAIRLDGRWHGWSANLGYSNTVCA